MYSYDQLNALVNGPEDRTPAGFVRGYAWKHWSVSMAFGKITPIIVFPGSDRGNFF
jgi:hypothetical protein